ncbi:MAG TPA: fluoride efflux transporter CrcB [Burkholderiales bacterium]|nr:fluoride efflux transporter CrcB [Burkholderiales bacterium]
MSFAGAFAVGIGAMLGAWSRWGLGVLLNPLFPTVPLGTLSVNLVGAYLIGVAIELFVNHAGMSPELRLFVITGFLGSMTTFSAFSAETVALLARQQYAWAATLIASHVIGSIAMTVLGILTVKAFSG